MDALRQHAVQDAGAAAPVAKGPRCRAGQSESFVDLRVQQHAAIADDAAAIECGLDNTPSDPPNATRSSVHFGIGDASAFIGVRFL